MHNVMSAILRTHSWQTTVHTLKQMNKKHFTYKKNQCLLFEGGQGYNHSQPLPYPNEHCFKSLERSVK